MTTRNDKNGSDISSDSSWTLINESDSGSRKKSLGDITKDVNNDNITKALLEHPLEEKNIANSDCQFEILEPTQRSKKKKSKLNSKKKTLDYMNILSIAACLLTITGITLLTTLLPPNYAESADIENIQHHLAEIYEHTNNPSAENAIRSIQATIEALEATKSMDAFNIISQNISDDQTCDSALQEFYNSSLIPEDISEVRIKVIGPLTKEMYEEAKKSAEETRNASKMDNSTKSLVEKAKDLVRSPTLQLFVATLVQDLCLIKLISEFSKRTNAEYLIENKESKQSGSKTLKTARKSSNLSKKKIKKPEVTDKNERNSNHTKQSQRALPINSNIQTLNQFNSMCQSINDISIDENGKSECERRFEELDSRWSSLGQNHRQKIQKIKNKFQKEILRINEIEKETFTRKQKIRYTREKFLHRLKTDREIYLHRLKKLREERQRVLSDICRISKDSRNSSFKDVSVGNLAVVLSSDYNFLKKLQDLKIKETPEWNIKLQATNNEIISYIPSNNTSFIETEEKEMNTKTEVKEIQEVITNIVNSLSEEASNSSTKQPSQESDSSISALGNLTEEDDFQVVRKKKAAKRNLSKLYDAAFEDQSKKIKQQDFNKWNKKAEDFKPIDWMTKQDPQKSHKQKLVYKGLL